ncbi:MAG: Ig-like domain-containing protein [Thermodesulfobacteriota bacterium]|nr:Ig-like domain-containing protein [Thermodesulfobacteriota bacterium]
MQSMKKEHLRYGLTSLFLLISTLALLISCGGGGGGGAEGEAVPGSLALGLSKNTVKTDNAEETTVTATVLDEFNAAMEGITVAFTATGGQLSASSAVTDAFGEAKVKFKSGSERNNRTETITAEVSGISSRSIPVLVTGTTITLLSDTSSLVADVPQSATATLKITVLDAASSPIYGAPVTVAVDPNPILTFGTATLAPSSGTTDFSGELTVWVTGTSPGDVWVRAEAQGAESMTKYDVGSFGSVFGIVSPEKDPIPGLDIQVPLQVLVSAPAPTTRVIFGTTVGVWDGMTAALEKAVTNGWVSATLTSTQAGLATIQVSDASDSTISDLMSVAISAPSSEASQIAVQAGSTTIAPSTGDTDYSTSLMAVVKNVTDQVVGGAAVSFTLVDPIGGGEHVSPSVVFTDFNGLAVSTFTSGALSSGAEGVTVRASMVNDPDIFSDIAVVIGGTAGSVVIGQSTKISSNATNTAYIMPMSVLVTDSAGNPVQTTVTLRAWPTRYATGDLFSGQTGAYENEDVNRNLILDGYNPDLCGDCVPNGEDVNYDCQLTPPSSAAGSVPVLVTTDENGVGNFDYIYLKQSAWWIEAEITGSTLVVGTETTSAYNVGWLPALESDVPYLPDSPYCHPNSDPCPCTP